MHRHTGCWAVEQAVWACVEGMRASSFLHGRARTCVCTRAHALPAHLPRFTPRPSDTHSPGWRSTACTSTPPIPRTAAVEAAAHALACLHACTRTHSTHAHTRIASQPLMHAPPCAARREPSHGAGAAVHQHSARGPGPGPHRVHPAGGGRKPPHQHPRRREPEGAWLHAGGRCCYCCCLGCCVQPCALAAPHRFVAEVRACEQLLTRAPARHVRHASGGLPL